MVEATEEAAEESMKEAADEADAAQAALEAKHKELEALTTEKVEWEEMVTEEVNDMEEKIKDLTACAQTFRTWRNFTCTVEESSRLSS